MRCIVILLLAVSGACAAAPVPDQPARVREATAICLDALDFAQGDVASLLDAKSRFTAQGWAEFMKKLQGWQDDKGAPTFSSRFVPSGAALDVRRHDGVLDLTLPGVLEQTSRNPYGGVSVTKYRAEIDVQFAESTRTVTHLKQRTCGGAGSHPSCL
ncbi:hypothetical protein [Dyella sp.]|jgi:hypothetical protein|uniref:hypothetical protein n=1 Tax=Dyella sp. TaxID=1869338 RepID=UPI002D79D7F7|nr:hypothetical protein [Dyella sp.]HET6432680.1 hypothetical protein [Dyella sp.]